MHKRQYLSLIYGLGVLILVASSTALAAVSGKIFGAVLDAVTGEPIIGVTVRLEGTNTVTKTDVDGEYFIMNVPSGKWSVAAASSARYPYGQPARRCIKWVERVRS